MRDWIDMSKKVLIAGRYRAYDVRHCFADISLGYTPRVGFDQGLSEMAAWLEAKVPYDRNPYLWQASCKQTNAPWGR
jgi:hypothetical protein